jgi:hypothetical protein
VSPDEISRTATDDRYFLKVRDRDWSRANVGQSMTMPYSFLCEGLFRQLGDDVGFEWAKVRMAKERDEFEFVEDVLKVSFILLAS